MEEIVMWYSSSTGRLGPKRKQQANRHPSIKDLLLGSHVVIGCDASLTTLKTQKDRAAKPFIIRI
jgi:hypothetical protein